MIDLQKVLVDRLKAVIESGAIESEIEKALKETITRVLKDQLTTYSAFGKQIEEKVKKALVIHDDIDLPSYNDLIVRIIQRHVEHLANDAVEKQVAARVKELLVPAPESIKLSELVEQYIAKVKGEHSTGCHCPGDRPRKITFNIEHSDRNFHYIYLDDEPNQRNNLCQIQIGLHHDKMFSLNFSDNEVEKRLFVCHLYGFERMLFQMKAAGSTIVMDCEPEAVDTTIYYGGDD